MTTTDLHQLTDLAISLNLPITALTVDGRLAVRIHSFQTTNAAAAWLALRDYQHDQLVEASHEIDRQIEAEIAAERRLGA